MLITTWIYLTLSAVSALSVAVGRPWTSVIARLSNPREIWSSPVFLETNKVLTGAWAVIFGAAALVSEFGPPMLHIAAGVVMTAMGVASTRVGRWYSERKLEGLGIQVDSSGDVLKALQDQIDAANPWDWEPPELGVAEHSSRDCDVIVIGSGVGGLTAGALLAKRGHRVTVVEQHTIPGGFCHSWKRMVHTQDGRARVQFDAGVHDVSGTHAGGTIDNILRLVEAQERIDWRTVSQEYVVGDQRIVVPEDWRTFVDELGLRFPVDRHRVEALFAEIKKVHDGLYSAADWSLGVPRPPQTVEGMLTFSAEHPTTLKWRHMPFLEMLDEFLTDPKLKQLLTVLTGYLTDRPKDLTVGNMAPIFGYYFNGGRYPAGGSQRFPDLLVQVIRENGGAVHFKSSVERILVANDAVRGIRLTDGAEILAPAVVSNADLSRTIGDLLKDVALPEEFASRFGKLETSTSGLAVQLVVDFVPDVEPITIVSDGAGLGFAMSIPSLVDPEIAPPGCAGIELLSFVSKEEALRWKRDDPDYASRKRKACDALVEQAAKLVPGLAEGIIFREDSTPRTFEHFAWTEGGAIYGPAIRVERPPAKTPVRGLVLAGSSVFPGPGVEAAVISGALAAHAIDPSGIEALGSQQAAEGHTSS